MEAPHEARYRAQWSWPQLHATLSGVCLLESRASSRLLAATNSFTASSLPAAHALQASLAKPFLGL